MQMETARKRLEKELEYLHQSPLNGLSAHSKDENLIEWTGTSGITIRGRDIQIEHSLSPGLSF
jgi:ubiquitin-protein ligase